MRGELPRNPTLGQITAYTYDGYQRVTEVDRYLAGQSQPDPCQSVCYNWDTDVLHESGTSVFGPGRISVLAVEIQHLKSGRRNLYSTWVLRINGNAMVRNKNKAQTIEQQLREFEARLRRQMLREKLDGMSDAFESVAMPQIHVSLGALQASKPEYEAVQGD